MRISLGQHSPHVVAEENEIHRLPLWGTGLHYKQQLNAEEKGGSVLWLMCMCRVMTVMKGQKEPVLFMMPGLQ